MPKPPLPDTLVEFLAQPNPSVIATVAPDGSLHTAATWYVWDDGRVLVNMDAGRKRLSHLRNDPRVSLTVLGNQDWSRHVSLSGRVTSFEPDPQLEGIDRLARHYTGQPFGGRDRERVSAWIEIDSWHAWAGAEPWSG
ncbi:MAG TPA: PPOX class F420-dependent oxidoreductase [Solirubrobacteraceae bacterium]|jgi:PPOX class probable F420-dependent enzyme